jgi:hypothetical protein
MMLDTLVSIIDKALRDRQGIFEYSSCPRCIFRLHVAAIPADIALSDGTRLASGSRIINLHLWNEHIPPFPPEGPTFGWARGLRDGLELSLRELAAFVASRPAFDDIVAVGANLVFASTQQTGQVTHLVAHYGFVRPVASTATRSLSQRLHLFGENMLISMLMMSRNPAALRADLFCHDDLPVYLHRTELMRRFGTHAHISAAR